MIQLRTILQKTKMFDDIVLSQNFIEDYDNLPKTIKKRVDRRVRDWSITGCLPPSAQAHRAYKYNESVWIVYVTAGHGAYRMLVEVKNSVLHMYHVGDHEQINKVLDFRA